MAKSFTLAKVGGVYKFVLAKNGASANNFVVVTPPAPKLATPTISKSGTTLTISDVSHATSYLIYQNNVQIGEVSASSNSKTFDLASIAYPVQNGTIKVVAHDSTEAYADSNAAALAELYPTQIVPTPSAEQVTISGSSMQIDTSSTGAEKNLVTLEQSSEVKGAEEFAVSVTSVNLNSIKALDGTDLPDGTYDVGVRGEKNGEAVSTKLAAGSFTKASIVVMLNNISWANAKSFTVAYDVTEEM